MNQLVMVKFPSDATAVLSADSALNEKQKCTIPTEFQSLINIGSLLPYTLVLKFSALIMLLRHINATQGLCSGMRLVVRFLLPHVVKALIATGSHEGCGVYSKKNNLGFNLQKDVHSPIDLQRLQFPARPAFGIPVNKSQGQTMDHIGLYLT